MVCCVAVQLVRESILLALRADSGLAMKFGVSRGMLCGDGGEAAEGLVELEKILLS